MRSDDDHSDKVKWVCSVLRRERNGEESLFNILRVSLNPSDICLDSDSTTQSRQI